jgi:hypothetical protein
MKMKGEHCLCGWVNALALHLGEVVKETTAAIKLSRLGFLCPCRGPRHERDAPPSVDYFACDNSIQDGIVSSWAGSHT